MINNLKTNLLINSMRNKVKNCTQLVGFLGSMVFMVNCGNGSTTSATPSGTGGGGNTQCVSTPYSGITSSSPNSVSHQVGGKCLDGCHNPVGGTTSIRWSVAGTMYTSSVSGASVAPAGSQVQVSAGTSLIVDACGNFYSQSATTNSNNPSEVKTTATMTPNPLITGNCNSANCHDGTSYLPMTAGARIY